jgi:hypothetical protein
MTEDIVLFKSIDDLNAFTKNRKCHIFAHNDFFVVLIGALHKRAKAIVSDREAWIRFFDEIDSLVLQAEAKSKETSL